EPVQEPASNEVEETNDKQSPEEETRMRTADEQLLQEAARREKRLGLRQSYPLIWIGDLFLVNFEVRVEIRLAYGDLAVFKNAAPSSTAAHPRIHVRKKLKFDDVPQKYLKQKIQAEKGSCVLIALPLDGNVAQWKCLQKQFIYYFNQQKIVGVSSSTRWKTRIGPSFAEPESEKVEKTDDKQPYEMKTSTSAADKEFASKRTKYEMLLFPPSKFVHRNLLPVAPKLTELLYKDQIPHLMLIISNFFHCLRCAQLLKENIQEMQL
ncbi:hypothetical protein AVEN_26640-1, partial [Araneus ventricosus]